MGRARCLILLACLAFASACTQATFRYTPGGPQSQLPRVPDRVAVLPFQDRTGDLVKDGPLVGSLTRCAGRVNMAKTGHDNCGVPYIPPDLFAKYFADEAAGSLVFGSARFAVGPDDISKDENVIIEGAILESLYEGTPGQHGSTWVSFAFQLRARSPAEDRPFWSKDFRIRQDWVSAGLMKNFHAHLMRTSFRRAVADLASALSARRLPDAKPPDVDGSPNESADEILKRTERAR